MIFFNANFHSQYDLLILNITVNVNTSAYPLYGFLHILEMLGFSVLPTEKVLFFFFPLLSYSQNGTVSCLNAPLGHH